MEVKVIKETKVELAVCQRLTHRNAGIFPLGVGQRHIIISFFVCTRTTGAGRRRYRKGACGAAASQRRLADASERWRWLVPLSQRRLWRQAPRRAGAVWRRRRRRQRRVSCIWLFLSLSAPAELALTGAANAEAPVAPGASPSQTKASLHTKEVKDIAPSRRAGEVIKWTKVDLGVSICTEIGVIGCKLRPWIQSITIADSLVHSWFQCCRLVYVHT